MIPFVGSISPDLLWLQMVLPAMELLRLAWRICSQQVQGHLLPPLRWGHGEQVMTAT